MTFETLRGSGPAAAVLGRGAPPRWWGSPVPPRAAEGTSPLKAPMARGGFPGPPLLTPEPCHFSEDTAGGRGGSWGTQSPAPASGIRVEHTCPSVPAPLADDRMCRKTVDNHKKGLDFHENRLFQPPERFL